jgi:hypothetical protein
MFNLLVTPMFLLRMKRLNEIWASRLDRHNLIHPSTAAQSDLATTSSSLKLIQAKFSSKLKCSGLVCALLSPPVSLCWSTVNAFADHSCSYNLLLQDPRPLWYPMLGLLLPWVTNTVSKTRLNTCGDASSYSAFTSLSSMSFKSTTLTTRRICISSFAKRICRSYQIFEGEASHEHWHNWCVFGLCFTCILILFVGHVDHGKVSKTYLIIRGIVSWQNPWDIDHSHCVNNKGHGWTRRR